MFRLIYVYSNLKVNTETHWRRQFATTLRKFHWQFLDFFTAMAKAKKLSSQIYSTGFGIKEVCLRDVNNKHLLTIWFSCPSPQMEIVSCSLHQGSYVCLSTFSFTHEHSLLLKYPHTHAPSLHLSIYYTLSYLLNRLQTNEKTNRIEIEKNRFQKIFLDWKKWDLELKCLAGWLS